MKLNLNTQETKELTKEKFKLSDSQVSFITDEFLNDDFKEFEDSFKFNVDRSNKTYWYGHNVAYGRTSSGEFVYIFLSGPNNGCETQRYTFYQSQWNHYSTSMFCGGIQDERHRVIRFERR